MKLSSALLAASALALSRAELPAQLPTTVPLLTEALDLELYRSPVPPLFAAVPTVFDSAHATSYRGASEERIAFVSRGTAGADFVIEGYQVGRPAASRRLVRAAETPTDGLDTVVVDDRFGGGATTYVRQWRAGALLNVARVGFDGASEVAYFGYDARGRRDRVDGGSPFSREVYTYDDVGRFDTWSRATGPVGKPDLTRQYNYAVRAGEDTLSLASVEVLDAGATVVTARYTADDSTLMYLDRAVEGTTELLYRSDDGTDSTRVAFIGRYVDDEIGFVETVYFRSAGFGPATGVRPARTPVRFVTRNPVRAGAVVAVASEVALADLSFGLVGAGGRVYALRRDASGVVLPRDLPAGAYVLTARAKGFAPYAMPLMVQ